VALLALNDLTFLIVPRLGQPRNSKLRLPTRHEDINQKGIACLSCPFGETELLQGYNGSQQQPSRWASRDQWHVPTHVDPLQCLVMFCQELLWGMGVDGGGCEYK
jgi:hypothetical protein